MSTYIVAHCTSIEGCPASGKAITGLLPPVGGQYIHMRGMEGGTGQSVMGYGAGKRAGETMEENNERFTRMINMGARSSILPRTTEKLLIEV